MLIYCYTHAPHLNLNLQAAPPHARHLAALKEAAQAAI